jgi:hypothetical protein
VTSYAASSYCNAASNGDEVPYTIIYMKGDHKIGGAPWKGDIGSAIHWAHTFHPVHEIQGGATRVVILDDKCTPVFSIPEDKHCLPRRAASLETHRDLREAYPCRRG